MLILVEGVDGSGKTTLCKRLIDDLKLEQVVVDRTSKDYNEQWENLLKRSENSNLICDRAVLTELVYRVKLGGDTNMKLSTVEKVLSNKHTINIFCRTETEFKDAMTRGEDNITDEDTSTSLSYMYLIMLAIYVKFSNISVVQYNWQENTYESLIRFIKKDGGIIMT